MDIHHVLYTIHPLTTDEMLFVAVRQGPKCSTTILYYRTGETGH